MTHGAVLAEMFITSVFVVVNRSIYRCNADVLRCDCTQNKATTERFRLSEHSRKVMSISHRFGFKTERREAPSGLSSPNHKQ